MGNNLTRGSKATAKLAEASRKPCLHLSAQSNADNASSLLLEFVNANAVKVLNVAGSRGSKEPELGTFVKTVLEQAWAPL